MVTVESYTSIFQVREARTFSCGVFWLVLVWFANSLRLWIAMNVWTGWNLCWVRVCVVQVRAVADTDRLAQARCAEARPELSARVVAQATRVCFWASTQLTQARGVSPKRDPVLLSCSCLSPCLGGGGLAWARLSRLSETPQPERGAGRDSAVFGWLVYFWMICLVGYECYDEGHVYNEVWCIRSMIHEF